MFLEALSALVLLFQQSDTMLQTRVRQAVAGEPIEVFQKDTGRVAVRGVVLFDVDADGAPEAFVWIAPSFRQTPTVLIYRQTAEGLRRVPEALAPGRLQPVSGHLRDPHTLGVAVDMKVGHGEAYDTAKVITAALDRGMSIVRYPGFFHADMREGFAAYLDLLDRAFPTADSETCSHFEFSTVEQVAGGNLGDQPTQNFLVVLTSQDLTLYQFHGFRHDGMLIKQTWVRPRPPNVTGMVTGPGNQLRLRTTDGRDLMVPAPQ